MKFQRFLLPIALASSFVSTSALGQVGACEQSCCVPANVPFGPTFTLPAAGQVKVDASTTPSTLAADASFAVTCSTATNTNICRAVLYTTTADLPAADGYYIGDYVGITNSANLSQGTVMLYSSAYTSSGTDTGGTVAFFHAASPTGGEVATDYIALQVQESFDTLIHAFSGDVLFDSYAPTIKTVYATGQPGPDLTINTADGNGGTNAAGDIIFQPGEGASTGDDGDVTFTMKATSQISIDANAAASSLGATDGVLEMTWKPAVGSQRHAILLAGNMSVNASTDTAPLRIDLDDVAGAALGAGVVQSAILITPSYSESDNATAIRAGITIEGPGTASSGVNAAIYLPSATTEFVTYQGASSTAHFQSDGSAPALSSCGTSPAIAGSDVSGKVTIGSGSITSCTVTFATAYAAAPACLVTGSDAAITYAATTSTSALTITSSGDMNADVVMYFCIQAN